MRPDLDELRRLLANYYDADSSSDPWVEAHDALQDFMFDNVDALLAEVEAGRKLREARPRAEWHEDDGAVLWWDLPVDEPPYCGTPNDEDFPEYKTHWTPLVLPDDAAVAKGGAE